MARSPVNYPLATSIAASALTMLAVTGGLLIEPWQNCAASNQSNSECLKFEFVLLLSPIPVQKTSLQPVAISHAPPVAPYIEMQTPPVITEQSSPAATKTNISPQPHVPQFPDFILPRPEPDMTGPAPQEAGEEQLIPDFVIYQMSEILVQAPPPPLPRVPNITPSGEAKLEVEQLLHFSFDKIIIQDGDNLWAISSQIYGSGRQYIRIFEANKDLISSPHRIFPGQVLALPKDATQNRSARE